MEELLLVPGNCHEDLTWAANTSALVRKEQQRLHFLQGWRNHLEVKLLVPIHPTILEPVLMYCAGVWFAASLWGQIGPEEGDQDCWKDHPLSSSTPGGHALLTLTVLNVAITYSIYYHHWGYKVRTNRLKNSFCPQTIRLLNEAYHHDVYVLVQIHIYTYY